MTRLSLTILAILGFLSAAASEKWHPDVLPGYESLTVNQPDDYSGHVVSTIIRLCPDSTRSTASHRRGALYVHGFNDYFFQAELGKEFASHGYDFYAVDLRKYGRSILPGQSPFQARSMSEYFPDIDSAIVVMKRNGIEEITLMGHSTGGLITACYMALLPDSTVKALILNSPFLDWNLSPLLEDIIPAVVTLGRWMPDLKIPQDGSDAYSNSLLLGHGGEWQYDTRWKMRHSPDVTAGWIRAITLAQNMLKSGRHPIRVPVLLMRSDHSGAGGDLVLDVNDISRFGLKLGPRVTELIVPGGFHDLILSKKSVRSPLYAFIFSWLKDNLPCTPSPMTDSWVMSPPPL